MAMKLAERMLNQETNEPQIARIPYAFDLPDMDCVGKTVGFNWKMERHIYRSLKMSSGDTIVFVKPDREVSGKLLVKPTDCILVTSDSMTNGSPS